MIDLLYLLNSGHCCITIIPTLSQRHPHSHPSPTGYPTLPLLVSTSVSQNRLLTEQNHVNAYPKICKKKKNCNKNWDICWIQLSGSHQPSDILKSIIQPFIPTSTASILFLLKPTIEKHICFLSRLLAAYPAFYAAIHKATLLLEFAYSLMLTTAQIYLRNLNLSKSKSTRKI